MNVDEKSTVQCVCGFACSLMPTRGNCHSCRGNEWTICIAPFCSVGVCDVHVIECVLVCVRG